MTRYDYMIIQKCVQKMAFFNSFRRFFALIKAVRGVTVAGKSEINHMDVQRMMTAATPR